MNAPVNTQAAPAATAQPHLNLEEEIYQLRGLVNLLSVTAALAEDQSAFIFGVRCDTIHGVLSAMQSSADRLYHAYHGKEARQ